VIQLSTQLRDHLLDGYDTAFPEGSTLTLASGDKPGEGTVIATFPLPAKAWNPSANGMKKLAEPLTAYAMATGVVGHYVLSSGGFTEIGSVSEPDGTGDLVLSATDVVPGTLITVHSFSKVA
jgi:hypothetical protein